MKQWYSAFELAGLPDLPALPNNITRKAKAQKWQSRQRMGRGGGQEYAYNSLPETTQTALIHNSDRIVDVNIEPSIGSQKVRPQVQQIKPTSEQRIDAWLAVLRAYEHWCIHHTFETVLDRDTAFVRAYNDQQLVLVNWVYAYLPKLSRSTLKAKQKLRREAATISALGGNYGHRRGTGRIDSDPDLQAAIETCLAAGGKHWGASQIYDILQLEFGLDPETCSLGQVQTWLRQFRAHRPQEWAMYMSPERVKGTVSPILEPSELDLLMQHLSLSEGRGFLAAVTTSSQEEQHFLDWLMGIDIAQLPVVNRRSILENALECWRVGEASALRNRQSLLLEDKQNLLHYIQEPEGLGVLRAYTNSTEEHQFQSWLLE
jgi:Mu DNA-binding domain